MPPIQPRAAPLHPVLPPTRHHYRLTCFLRPCACRPPRRLARNASASVDMFDAKHVTPPRCVRRPPNHATGFRLVERHTETPDEACGGPDTVGCARTRGSSPAAPLRRVRMHLSHSQGGGCGGSCGRWPVVSAPCAAPSARGPPRCSNLPPWGWLGEFGCTRKALRLSCCASSCRLPASPRLHVSTFTRRGASEV